MEKFQFKEVLEEPFQQSPLGEPWRVMIVDDDPEMHSVTSLVLRDLVFDNRPLEFKSVYSGHEAISTLQKDPSFALIILDVVMETDDAGLRVVKSLRDEMHQHMVRIILRTGQPGIAPERKVVMEYDINDYKGKHDLTMEALYTSVISALRNYKELKCVEGVRYGLQKSLDVLSGLYAPISDTDFFQMVALETSRLLPFSNDEEVSILVGPESAGFFDVIAGTGKFEELINNNEKIPEHAVSLVNRCVREKQNIFNSTSSVFRIKGRQAGHVLIIYVDGFGVPARWEQQLIDIYCAHLSSAYDNVHLISDLKALNLSLEGKVNERTQQYKDAKLAAEEASRSKSIFLSNMSHEIRTPLNAILGFAQILERDQSLPKSQRELIESIHSSGNHLLELICDVLDLSKIEAGVMTLDEEIFSLKDLLNDVSVMFFSRCDQKGIEWEIHNACEDDTPVKGDKRKLRQILINLVGNAIKFTQGGSVTLHVSSEPDYQYCFSVEDTGVGISKADQEKLFESFYQGETEVEEVGTGLGLAISNRQVALMGGELKVESELGKGSRFFFTVNLKPSLETLLEVHHESQKQHTLKAGSELTALVVDDVLTNRQVLSQMLADIGAEVITAVNGAEALDILRKEHVDIVFMDIRMPEMRGDTAIRIIRSEFTERYIVCVAISAFSMIHEVQQYLDIGFDQFISKPFQFQEVYDHLTELLDVEWAEDGEASADDTLLEPVAIEPELRARFIEAAERNRYTELKAAIMELEETDAKSMALAAEFSKLLRRYDTETMLSMLKDIPDVQ